MGSLAHSELLSPRHHPQQDCPTLGSQLEPGDRGQLPMRTPWFNPMAPVVQAQAQDVGLSIIARECLCWLPSLA